MRFRSKKQQDTLTLRHRDRSGGRAVRVVSGPTVEQRYAFRRNRTLTGSLASNVASADIPSSQLKSPRLHAHDLRRHRRRLFLVLGCTAATTAFLTYLLLNFIATPRAVAESGRPLEPDTYDAILRGYLNERPLERLRFAIDSERLAEYMQQNGAPEVKSVSSDIRLTSIGEADFVVSVREPAVVWRTGDAETYVDREGVAFSRNHSVTPSVEVVDKSGIRVDDNQVLASDRLLGFIGRAVGAMANQGYTVAQVEIPAGVTRQVDIKLDGVEYPVKLSIDRPAGEQAEDAARAVRHMVQYDIYPKYLDVRVSGKAYFLER